MRVIEKVRAVLHANATLAALVGERMYPGVARENTEEPYVVMSVVSDVGEVSLEGFTSGLHRARVQIDCYSRKYDKAQEVGDAVEGTLKTYAVVGLKFVRLNRNDGFEAETLYHRVQMDFSVWLNEE